MSSSKRRIVYAAIAALVAFAAPLLLWWIGAPKTEGRWLIALVLGPMLGPMVFEFIIRPRPEWTPGISFAAALGVAAGLWSGITAAQAHSSPGPAAFIGALIFGLTLIVGAIGATLAWLFSRSLDPSPGERGVRRVKAWHVGTALALAEVVVVAAIAGSMA